MQHIFIAALAVLLLLSPSCKTDKQSSTTEYFPVKEYTLKNGLKVFISVNKQAPRVQTMIAVKAGSKFDPAETTGLAHYLEHMVFKGTRDFGSLNWAQESVLLDSVSALFEAHKAEKDEAKKRAIYKRIDSFSYEASKVAIPNEYDKMTTSLGAQGTNAFTSTDMTVYINDIPSNALNKWLKLEANRFKTLVLRLFHTELEAVYEEFNISQDRDGRWSYQEVAKALMPNHPYGTQTTIGEGEHLKNPSMVNIHNYFNTYYRPNNVAIILAGDVDPDKAVAEIEKQFGDWEAKDIPTFTKAPPVEIKAPIEREIKGPQAQHVYIGYRFDGAGTKEAMMASLVDGILANGQAGLIDLDLVQKQKVLKAYSFIDGNTDYTVNYLYAEPRQGQTLEEAKDLLLGEVEKVKKGEFEDWILSAIVLNKKLEWMKTAESNDGRAYSIMDAFVHNIPWEQKVKEIDELSKVTKADLVAFANKHYGNNYAVCYKRIGEPNRHKVEKPQITPVAMNKDTQSAFKAAFEKEALPSVQPKFMDFDKDIKHLKLAEGVEFDYIRNDLNKTFSLNYIFDMGSDNIRKLGLAIDYLKFIGTDKYSAEDLKKEFFKLGLTFGVNSGRDRVYVSLSGLEENLDKGVELFEHILANVQPDTAAYKDFVSNILQARANAKLNKGQILHQAMANYAKYGAKNPFNNIITEAELKATDPAELVTLIKELSGYKHKVFYYGQLDESTAKSTIAKYHKIAAALKDYPEAIKYPELPIEANTVYFCDFNMRQAEARLLAKDVLFDKSLYTQYYLYNEYYGSGLSSIMFQEIREKMGLAYAVSSWFDVPQYADRSHYVGAYVGTQSDKLKTSLTEINKLLNEMPKVPQQFDGAKQNVIKSIETDWITGENIYWQYDRAKKLGLTEDVRKQVYAQAKNESLETVETFFNQHVKGKKYTYCVLGNKKDLNLKELEAFGTVKELKLEEVFGY